MLQRCPELRALFGVDRSTALWVLVLVAAQVALAVGLGQRPLWQMAIAAYVIGAPLAHALGILVHECAHNLVFRSTGANKALSIVANVGLGAPGAIAFRHEHLAHHRFLGDGREPDGGDTQAPLSREIAWSGQSAWRRLASFTFGRFFFARRSTNRTPMDGWLVANHAVCLLALAALLAVGGLVSVSYILLSLLFAFGPHPLGGRRLAEHLTLRRGQPTVSYYGPANRICFDVGYHVEHHDFPHVPWRRLRRLHAWVRDDYVRLASVTSWWRLLIAHLVEPGRHAGQYVGFADDYVERVGLLGAEMPTPVDSDGSSQRSANDGAHGSLEMRGPASTPAEGREIEKCAFETSDPGQV
jgi:sphingolipid delta-4 desaturase